MRTYVPTTFDDLVDGPALVEVQVTETLSGDADRKMHADWFVVDGSGTGELTRLRGAGGVEAQLGQNGIVWLDYSLE